MLLSLFHDWIYISKMNQIQSSRLVYSLAGVHRPPWWKLALGTWVPSKSSVAFPPVIKDFFDNKNSSNMDSREDNWLVFSTNLFILFNLNTFNFIWFFEMFVGNVFQQFHKRIEYFLLIFTSMILVLCEHMLIQTCFLFTFVITLGTYYKVFFNFTFFDFSSFTLQMIILYVRNGRTLRIEVFIR